MALAKRDYTGQEAFISMTEFRSMPGEVVDRVIHGMIVHLTKKGRCVASITPWNDKNRATPNPTLDTTIEVCSDVEFIL